MIPAQSFSLLCNIAWNWIRQPRTFKELWQQYGKNPWWSTIPQSKFSKAIVNPSNLVFCLHWLWCQSGWNRVSLLSDVFTAERHYYAFQGCLGCCYYDNWCIWCNVHHCQYLFIFFPVVWEPKRTENTALTGSRPFWWEDKWSISSEWAMILDLCSL